MSGEKKSGMDRFFDALDKGADGVVKGLSGVHHPNKDYDREDEDKRTSRVIDIDPAQGMSVEQKMMVLRMQLYAAVQKLRGDELEAFRDLIDEVQLSAESLHGKRSK